MNVAAPSRRPRPSLRRAFAVGACAFVAASCSIFTTMTSTPGPRPLVHPLPVADTQLFDWKGVVHCHSYLSHDCKGTIAEIAAACRTANIDFVAMTDHQTDASIANGQRGMVGDTLFMVGCEQRCPQGTVLAFPLRTPLRRWQHAALLAKEADEQGGVAFVCHAELWKTKWDVPGFTGVEIVNLHAGVMGPNKVLTLLTGIFMPLRILFERICWRDAAVLTQWDERLAAQHPFAPVGGNDAHASVRMLGPLGGTIGNYQECFLSLSTHVLAEELSEAALVRALKAGRSYVSFDIFGEGAGFDFRAVDADGVHLVGSTVTASPSLRLAVRVPQAGQIQLWRDGAIVREVEGDRLDTTDVAPGIYRIEVRALFGSPWIFSSSIKVAPAGG